MDNVLVAPIGTEAQIVSTAVFLLGKKGININKIIVLHSTTNDENLSMAIDRIKDYYADIPFMDFELRPFSRKGKAVEKMGTALESEITLYTIYNVIRELKNNGDTVHLLCSGGRKIIAAYAMLTAQMLFGDKDRLWYLISEGEFLKSRKMLPETGQDMKETNLIRLPFLSWQGVLPSITEINSIEDPMDAYDRISKLEKAMKYNQVVKFIKKCTPKQFEVLSLMVGEELTNEEIVERMFISKKTLESHQAKLYQKAEENWNLENVERTKLCMLTQVYFLENLSGKKPK